MNANRCQHRVVWLVSAASRRRRTLWPSSKRISLWICTFYSSPFSLQTTSCTKVLHVIFWHTTRSRQTSRSQHFSWKTKLRPHQPTSHYSHFLRLRVRFIFLSSFHFLMLQSRAPTLASRSPTKPTSPVRDRRFHDDDENENEPALARFARQKQREQASINNLSSRPGGPKTFTSPPKPEKWSVKDTSVNIATAFTQAANDMLPAHTTPNTSWASTSSRTVVPRSTSVEYESQVQSTTSRRLAAPNSKVGSRPPNSNSNPSRKPLSKADTSLHVPDSEDERPSANGRGKSPFEQVAGAANRALQTATFYLRARSKEPQVNDTSGAANNQNGNDSSYDYGAEESIYQASQGKRTSNAAHKRNRISIDNKAWKPSASDIESDEEYSDNGKKGRGKKKGPHGGPLTNLPSIGASKGRKKKTKGNKGSKGNTAGGEHEDESDGETQTDIVSGPDIVR